MRIPLAICAKKYFGDEVKLGLETRFVIKGRKDMIPFVNLKKNVVFIDDDPRHYTFQSCKKLIEVLKWRADEENDDEFLKVINKLENLYPVRFAAKIEDLTGNSASEDEDETFE